MKKTPKVPGMPVWIDLGSDVNWIDYHGSWARKAKDGSWYVIEFQNMFDACGEEDCKRDGLHQYACAVTRIDLSILTEQNKRDVLQVHGFVLENGQIVNEHDGEVVASTPLHVELILVETTCRYGGFSEKEKTVSSDKHATRLRAECRRYADRLCRE